MFIEQQEYDFLTDEVLLLHQIIGYPTMTFRKFKPIKPIEEGKPIPDSRINMEQVEVPWNELSFEHRKDLVNGYLALGQDNIDYIDKFTHKYKLRANIATFTAVFMAGVALLAIWNNWR